MLDLLLDPRMKIEINAQREGANRPVIAAKFDSLDGLTQYAKSNPVVSAGITAERDSAGGTVAMKFADGSWTLFMVVNFTLAVDWIGGWIALPEIKEAPHWVRWSRA